MKWTIALTPLLLCAGALSRGFTGQFAGIPQDALEAQESGQQSLVLNGLNYQSRIDINIYEISPEKDTNVWLVPVKKLYSFDVSLGEGEYELFVSSHDFNLRNGRYRVLVDGEMVRVFEDYFGSLTYNVSSMQVVDFKNPMVIDVLDYKEYYETHSGKLSDMVMNSPVGFIFKNRTYTLMFIVSVGIMVAPYILPYISPELAEEFQEMKVEAGQRHAGVQKVEKIESKPKARNSKQRRV